MSKVSSKVWDQGLPASATDRSLPVGKIARPAVGWLRVVRDGLDMTLAELAVRMKVTPPAVRSFEQAESEDRITLASLRRAAAAMDHDLVYALVPRTGKLAQPRQRRTTHIETGRPVPPPEAPSKREPTSIVTDLTRHTEFGDA